MILQILVFVVLLRIFILTEKPFLSSGLYTLYVFIFSLASGDPLNTVLGISVSVFILSSLYFLLLDRAKGIIWWFIMITGIILGTGGWQYIPFAGF